ncbi:unnamed protein product [Schistosoma bovis]|nr:unnamed protein product [Schistosoma bovis]
MSSTTDDKNNLTENNENPINECSSPTTSLSHNSLINSSFSPSSSCITDLCAWCQKPNLQTYKYNSFYQSVNLDNTKYKIKPVPVCCSQICFDNLRRAYFKNRRNQLNSQLLDEIPAMVISGRLPYTSDSDKEKLDNKRQSTLSYQSNTSCNPPVTITNITTNNKLSSKKRFHNQYSDQQHHSSQDTVHKSSANNSQRSNYDFFSHIQMYSQLNNYINKDNTKMSIPLYDYIIQRFDMNQFISNFRNIINIDHIPSTTITNTNATNNTNTNHDINTNPKIITNLNNELINSNLEPNNQLIDRHIEIMNIINQLLMSSINHNDNNDHNHIITTTTTNNNNNINSLDQLLIIPIPIPIFKMAPNILNILHQYGYHSINSCKYYSNKQFNLDETNQTTNLHKFIMNNNNHNISSINNLIENNYKQTNEINKTQFIDYLNKTNEKALDLSLSNKKINSYYNKNKLKQRTFYHKYQQQNKRYLNKKLLKQTLLSGIYKLIHPVTKHCYTVKIIPIK